MSQAAPNVSRQKAMSAAKPSAASVCAVDIVVGWYGLVRQQNGLVRHGFTSRGVATLPAPPAAAVTTGRWISHASHCTPPKARPQATE